MPLIIQNETASDIEIDQLGLTVPASATYDLSYRPTFVVAESTELAGHIANGNISVTTDTLNTLANATGYMQVASGDTSARPATPKEGMTRFNTDTNVIETFFEGEWHNAPLLRDTVFRADPTSTVLYRKTPDNKFLSVGFTSVTFASASTANLSWVYIDSNLTHAMAGYNSAFHGTITYIGAYTDTTGKDKSVSIYVNNTEYANAVTFTGSQTSNSVATSLDFSPGDMVRLRMRSPTNGKLGAMYITVFFCLRDPT